MYRLIRMIDGQQYGDPKHFEQIEDIVAYVRERIAHSSHCDVDQIGRVETETDDEGRTIIGIARNQYYWIQDAKHQKLEQLLKIAQRIVDDKSAWEHFDGEYEVFSCGFCSRELRGKPKVEYRGHSEDCPILQLTEILNTGDLT
jgi:hypothetical protein